MDKKLQNLSDEELLKEEKNRKTMFYFFCGLVAVMVVSGIISTVREGVNTFTFLPLAFLGLVVIFWSNYSKIKKEIKTRNLK